VGRCPLRPPQLLVSFALVIVLAAGVAACGTPPEPPPPREVTVWRQLAAWSGKTLVQTESFISDTGLLRLRWATSNQRGTVPGTFTVTLHSAVSGRPLLDPIERRGVHSDEAVISEDPRSFFLVIESTNLDWTLSVDEGIPGTTRTPRDR
jgi:hypothetical protein